MIGTFIKPVTPVAVPKKKMTSLTLQQKVGAVCGILGVTLMLSVGSYFIFFRKENEGSEIIKKSDDIIVITGSKNDTELLNNNSEKKNSDDSNILKPKDNISGEQGEEQEEGEQVAKSEKEVRIEQETIREIVMEAQKCLPAFIGKSPTNLSGLISIVKGLGDAEKLTLSKALLPLLLDHFKEYNVLWEELNTGGGVGVGGSTGGGGRDLLKILSELSEKFKEISFRISTFDKVGKHMPPESLQMHPEVLAALQNFARMGQQCKPNYHFVGQ